MFIQLNEGSLSGHFVRTRCILYLIYINCSTCVPLLQLYFVKRLLLCSSCELILYELVVKWVEMFVKNSKNFNFVLSCSRCVQDVKCEIYTNI